MKYYYFIILILLGACTSKQKRFEKLSSSETGITFNNTIKITDSLNVLKFEYIYNGGGVGVGDVNGDGKTDVFFAGNQVSSKLYLNKGESDFEFEDITDKSGVGTSVWCTGVAMIDINQDGKLDIFVSTINPKIDKTADKLLFINQGNNADGIPTFKESAKLVGLSDGCYSTQAAFLDYDLDGDLDAYLLTNAIEHFNRNNSMGQRTDGGGRSVDKLYRNEGNNTQGLPIFKDVSKEAGILTEGWGLGIIVNDFNKDGYPDVYVGNDFLANDHLYINNQNGTFSNKIESYLKHQSHNSMGLDMADINNDGLNDLVVVDMLPDDNLRQKTMFGTIDYDKYQENLRRGYQPQFVRNVLQLNNGNNSFSDIGYMAGVAATDWSWSPLLADFDNDGFRDLLITNGYRLDVTDLDFVVYRGDEEVFGDAKERAKKMKEAFGKLKGVKKSNFFYKNKGDLTFENVAEQYGLDAPSYTNGTAYADFDNDGDLDLVMNNIDDEAFVYQNNTIQKETKEKTENSHFLRIKLSGNSPNIQGLGANVSLYFQGKTQYAEHQTIRGFKSTVENVMHFGLGNIQKIDSLKIIWATGKEQTIRNIAVDKVLTLQEKEANKPAQIIDKTSEMIFEEVAKVMNIDFSITENDYNDFLIQHTLPHKHSEMGAGIAVGDVNGDKLEDFFIGGPAHQKGAFFLQNANNTFRKIDFVEKNEEDTGVVLFDADNDNDLDLYCVSGSSEFTMNYNRYQDRLYKNDGKGNFSLATNTLPPTKYTGSCVTVCDFDKDGDLDLFRGGRVRSTEYPLTPESYLLRNDGKGNFTDVTAQLAKNLNNIGMVSASLWTDFDKDGWHDLMLVGEFMPLTIFKNQQGKSFSQLTIESLKNTSGWWNNLAAGDFDKDGDIDFVAGNLGLNSKLKASVNEPVTACAKDFDDSGTMDVVLTAFNYGKEYSIHPRGVLIDQLIAMRRRFKTFKEYGETTFENMIPETDLKGTTILKATQFASCYIENKGDGKFDIKPLPMEAQISPMNGILAKDINGDGNLDLLTIGNDYATETLTGRYDAGIGNFLLGDGKGNFKNVSVTKSHFFVTGDAKNLAEVKLKDGSSLFLASRNNEKLLAFRKIKK
jgi:enediyne biosynthesis protein E4